MELDRIVITGARQHNLRNVTVEIPKERKGEHREVIEQVRKSGFTRVRVDGVVVSLDDEIRLDKRKKHTIDAVVDRLVSKPGLGQRLHDSVETALRHGEGIVVVAPEGRPDLVLSEHRACHHCGISFPEPSPQLFSFNSPRGMCPECSGLGTRLEMDPDLVVPNPDLSVNEGAVKPLGAVGEATTWGSDIVRAVARERGIDLNAPWRSLPPAHRQVVLYGTGNERVAIRYKGSMGSGSFRMRYEGAINSAINSMMRRMRETKSEDMRQHYQRFLSSRPCSACSGQRIRREALGVRVAGRTIAEVTALAVADGFAFFDSLKLEGTEAKIAAELLKEIRARLRFLLDVGLGYLTLDRAAPTLSGGEGQRIRLASQIGSELTGVIYVLDEPSIGLHQRDNRKLLAALRRLRDIGNTVVVVERDSEAAASLSSRPAVRALGNLAVNRLMPGLSVGVAPKRKETAGQLGSTPLRCALVAAVEDALRWNRVRITVGDGWRRRTNAHTASPGAATSGQLHRWHEPEPSPCLGLRPRGTVFERGETHFQVDDEVAWAFREFGKPRHIQQLLFDPDEPILGEDWDHARFASLENAPRSSCRRDVPSEPNGLQVVAVRGDDGGRNRPWTATPRGDSSHE